MPLSFRRCVYTVLHPASVTLCLLSGPANSAAGQDPFEAKKAGYSPLTALARQIKEHTGRWDMKAVRERSQKLAKEAVQIWAWSNV